MNNHHRLKFRDEAGQQTDEQESGQIILILALAMVGLLVAAGLAVDAGMLFMRKALLDRAVDSAALAGVVELDTTIDPGSGSDPNLPRAHVRGMQLLAANDIVLTKGDDCPVDPDNPGFWTNAFWQTYDYCGVKSQGTIPGSIRYAVYARWHAPLFFMPIIGFDDVPLRANAEAEYMSLVDIYASDTNEIGVIKTSTQAIFGPDICPGFGDPYTPRYDHGSENQNWPELQGAYTYRISVPPSFFRDGRTQVRVEIFDPDTYNQPSANHNVYRLNGNVNLNQNHCSTANPDYSRKSTCTIDTGDSANPAWFVNIDENRGGGSVGSCSEPSNYTDGTNTLTLYRLYYYMQDTSGNLQPVDLAFYVGQRSGTEAQATDMHWVSPGVPAGERMPAFNGSGNCVYDQLAALDSMDSYNPSYPFCVGAEPATTTPNCAAYRSAHPDYTDSIGCSADTNGDFVVDFDTEVPDIFEDPSTGVKQLYLQVRGYAGASENSYELWAGPSRAQDTSGELDAPSDVNARQVYLQALLAHDPNPIIRHRSQGVGVFGIGHLPMNSVAGGEIVDIPLTYLGPQFAGQEMTVAMYDPDSGGQDPIIFYFDSIPITDWSACFDDDYNENHHDDYYYHEASLPHPNNESYNSNYGTCEDVFHSPRIAPATIGNVSNGYWTTPEFSFEVPSDATGVPFYGGRLYARYWAGNNDTYGWKITLEGRPFLTQ
jgi:hypothetical protein